MNPNDQMEGGEEDMWGDLEVQENIIPALLEGTVSPMMGSDSSRKVRFTANSTLAVYPSEKSLSGEEGGSDDEYYEEYDEDDEEEDDEDDEDEDATSDSEEAFSDDEVVINDYRDSLDLPFIHTGSTPHNPSTVESLTTTTPPDCTTTPQLSPPIATPISVEPPFNKESLRVDPPQESSSSGNSPSSQRKWYQQKQTYQRYTPRYSPKSSPTDAQPNSIGGEFNLSSSSIPPPSHSTPQEKPLLVQQLERAKLELNQGKPMFT